MKVLLPIILICSIFSACNRHGTESPGQEEPMNLASYRAPKGRFSCKVPADWRVQENSVGSEGVSFFGPASGPKPYSESIAIYYYAKDSEFKSPQDYAAVRRGFAMLSTPVRQITKKGITMLEFTAVHKSLGVPTAVEPRNVKEHDFLIPAKDGFFAIVHSAPESRSQTTGLVLRTMLENFHILE